MLLLLQKRCFSFSLSKLSGHHQKPVPCFGWEQGNTRYSSTYSRLFLARNDDQNTNLEDNNNNNNNNNNKQSTTTIKKNKTKKVQTYRVDRVLANRGWASRSECFEVLQKKRVYIKEENSTMRRILGPSERLPMDASLWIDGKKEVARLPPLLRVYHKPKWVLSTMGDKHGRRNLESLDFISNMHPVGRLDYDSSGLLLFSSEGPLTQTLLHPSHKIEKEYAALVIGSVDEQTLRETLALGVTTSMGTFPSHLVSAQAIPEEEVKSLIAVISGNLPPEYDREELEEKRFLDFEQATELSIVRLIVEEGKHRMVRRILANSGHPVIGLKRERLGVIQLGDLEEGQYRDLTPEEAVWANSLLKKKVKYSPPKKKE
jgi:23S rRNA pseudouridine2605 synthase